MNLEGFKETEMGMIPEDWDVKKFSEVAEIKHGYQFRNYDFTKEGIKVFKITQIKSNGVIDVSSCDFIDKNRLKEFERVLIKKGDILMALTGATIGKIARFNNINEPLLQNYRVGNFIPIKEHILSKDYLYYYLSSNYFFNQILARQTQSAQQNIGKDEINNMLIILPDIAQQQSIAKILTSLDSKIELNQKMNQTLEEIGQAIFKQWFIHYEFPNDEGKPYKSSYSEMVDSELGKIPNGWEVVSVSDAVELNPKLKVERDIEKIHVPMAGLSKNSMIITEFEMRNSNSGAKFQNYDTLFARITPSAEHGKTGFVQFLNSDEEVAIGSTEFIVMRSKTLNPYYVYCLARYEKLRKHAINSMTGTSGRQRVQNDCFNSFFIAQPIEEVLFKFEQLMSPIFKKIELLNRENQNLSFLRDSLLPKLISGKIRVK